MDILELGVAVHLLTHREPAPTHKVAHLATLLDPDECARTERFRFERHRNAFILAHAFLRLVLSQYERVPPDAWRFRSGPWGKPEIAGPVATSLQFNLSHTRGFVACAVTRHREVGIDVERLDPIADMLPLAARFFSSPEVAALRTLRATEQVLRFYQLWTLKEAYVKARGLGLSLPVDRVTFTIDAEDVTAALDAVLEDDAATWRFVRFNPTPRHHVAVAVRGPGVEVWTVNEGAA